MTITKAEHTARKKQCGTESPERARSWILAINVLEDQTWASLPAQVLACDRADQVRILGSKNLALCAQDFVRCFPHRKGLDGRTRKDLPAIREFLADAFDLPVAG